MAKRVAVRLCVMLYQNICPPKLGTMPVISSWNSGKDQTISIAVNSISSSMMRRTVFVCVKVARGRAAIAQSTCWYSEEKIHSSEEMACKTTLQTSQNETPGQKGKNKTNTKAIQALTKTRAIRTDTTLDLWSLRRWFQHGL